MTKTKKIIIGLSACCVFALLISQLVFPVISALGFCIAGALTLKTMIEK
jgi:hypothetical protein